MVTIFRDSTSEQKRDEELQRASKLESVALLAGGIAHDFNNILTAMLGHIALAQNHAAPAETVINSLEKACLHATDLTRQLLSFAKGNAPNRQVESIGAIVRESVDFALHGTALRGVFDIPPGGLHPVEVDRGQIHQVINNLVINATQAAHDRGRLRVTVDNVAVTREQPVGTLAPGAYVRVSIEDNGTGIPPEHLTRIFDPYFTTKETGTGLGLATAYSIIKKHDGLIRVESEPGHGTTFFIYLPASQRGLVSANHSPVAPPEGTEAISSGSASAPAGAHGMAGIPLGEPEVDTPVAVEKGKYILFMDDEDILQELVSAMLGYLGYEVVCAANGDETIEQFQRARDARRPFDVVMVDLTVPGGMGGFKTVQQLRLIDPHVKAVVSSGYSNDPILTKFRKHGFSGVIAKPYQMSELDQVLRTVMGLPPAAE